MEGIFATLNQLKKGMILVVYVRLSPADGWTATWAFREADIPWGCDERRTIWEYRVLREDGSYDLNYDWEPVQNMFFVMLEHPENFRVECEDEDR